MPLATFLGWRNTSIFVIAVVGFYVLEQMWPLIGVTLFVGLALTVGMGHGALDMVLLLAQFKPRRRAMAVALVYLVVTCVAGWLLSYSFVWAFILLLVMSVWHFGEIYAENLLLRLSVGGTSIMAPFLVQKATLSDLMQDVAGQNADVLLLIWSGLAWAWAGLVVLVLLRKAMGKTKNMPLGTDIDQFPATAVVEMGVVVCLSIVLSPLLMFALYFGLFHCTTHVARVWRAISRHQSHPRALMVWSWSASMAMTSVLLGALWYWLPNANMVASHLDAQMVHWLVVALGALTVPHLLLVGFSDSWLGR